MTRASELYGQPWREREYVVVLHYYFEHRGEPRHEAAPFVQELASLLRRTPASILMRMENFTSLDPGMTATRRGLAHVSPFCRRVFDRWHADHDVLRACAEAFMRDARADSVLTLFDPGPVRVPTAFGKYELLDLIGEGAFGIVFSCIDTETGNAYAMKIVRVEKLRDDECLHRFVREIRALSAIEHPNVIRIREDNLDEERSFPAFVMELARGSLRDHLDETARMNPRTRPVLSTGEACQVFHSVLAAVEALHTGEPRVVHRDINPLRASNRMIHVSGGTSR